MGDTVDHPVEDKEDVVESYEFSVIMPKKTPDEDGEISWGEPGDKISGLPLLTTDGVLEMRMAPGTLHEGWNVSLNIPDDAEALQIHGMEDPSLPDPEDSEASSH